MISSGGNRLGFLFFNSNIARMGLLVRTSRNEWSSITY